MACGLEAFTGKERALTERLTIEITETAAIADLAETGAVTNSLKGVHPGRIVTSFVSGTRRVFDFENARSKNVGVHVGVLLVAHRSRSPSRNSSALSRLIWGMPSTGEGSIGGGSNTGTLRNGVAH